jgi:hypothetical protein
MEPALAKKIIPWFLEGYEKQAVKEKEEKVKQNHGRSDKV